MSIEQEFSRYAHEYGNYNTIQTKVKKELLRYLHKHHIRPKKVLDLGCGEGALYKAIEALPSWNIESFVGVDFAQGMLDKHPKDLKITLLKNSFNSTKLFENLEDYDFDYIFSLSALQWAENLEFTLKKLHQMKRPFSIALFTSGTFHTLTTTAGVAPLLRSEETIKKHAKKIFKSPITNTIKYRLSFENNRDMLNYIKKSGVSGSRRQLSITQTRKLLREYPLNYLEFEVIFIHSS